MAIITTIILNIIILNIWLRITNNICNIFKYSKKIIIQSIYYGIAGAGSIYIYPQLLRMINKETLSFTQTINLTNIGLFLIYISIRTIIFSWPTSTKQLKKAIIYIPIFVSSIGVASLIIHIGGTKIQTRIPLFFLVMATAEERVKRIGGYKSYKKYYVNTSDIILFVILVALGFSFWENILLSLGTTSSDMRIPLYMIHAVFSGIIARTAYKQRTNKQKNRRIWIGILISIRGHTIYNTSAHKITIINALFLICMLYFVATRLLYKTETLYIKKN